MAGAPFGLGMLLVFLSMMNYLIDCEAAFYLAGPADRVWYTGYTVYAASVLAANSVLRSLFGAAFPVSHIRILDSATSTEPLPQLFTTPMFRNIGIHWGVAVPGFLALLCLPFPFVFYKYGAPIRERCKWTRKSEEAMKQMMQKKDGEPEKPTSESAAEQNGDQTSSVRRSQSERTLAEADEVRRGPTQKNSTR